VGTDLLEFRQERGGLFTGELVRHFLQNLQYLAGILCVGEFFGNSVDQFGIGDVFTNQVVAKFPDCFRSDMLELVGFGVVLLKLFADLV
jgi:hypothetical protein